MSVFSRPLEVAEWLGYLVNVFMHHYVEFSFLSPGLLPVTLDVAFLVWNF